MRKSDKLVISSSESCPFCGAKRWYPWAIEVEETVQAHLVENRGTTKKKYNVREETWTEIVEITNNMASCYTAIEPNVDRSVDVTAPVVGSLYVDECACCGISASTIV